MSELLPCPFCGGEAITIQEHGWWVVCTDCTAEIGFEGMTDTNGCYGSYQTEAEAIEAWNTRAERTCERITLGLEREREIATVSWICSACGKHMNSDHDYCPNCGAKVVEQ